MNCDEGKLPGPFWNFPQPIEVNVSKTMTGTNGGLAARIFGNDLNVLEEKGEEITSIVVKSLWNPRLRERSSGFVPS